MIMPFPINLSDKMYDVILNSAKEKQLLNEIKKDRNFLNTLKDKLDKVEDKDSKIKNKKLLETCYDFEALFIGQMIKAMRKTINETDFFGKSIAKDIFSDMLYDEYAKNMAKTEQFGIAKQIYNQLSA